eukprot:jgi/Chlat1/2969/Chrsp2S04697
MTSLAPMVPQARPDELLVLHTAAARGEVSTLKAGLEAGLDPLQKDGTTGGLPLHWAAQNGQIEAAEYLLKHNDINARNKDGNTPLHYAAVSAQLEMVEWLLKKGANPNAMNISGQTPMHGAARQGYIGTMKALKQAGADVNARDECHSTALHAAAQRWWSSAAFDLLLEMGANRRLADLGSNFPVHPAEQRRQFFLTSCTILIALAAFLYSILRRKVQPAAPEEEPLMQTG